MLTENDRPGPVNRPARIVVTTLMGLVPVLERELVTLGFPVTQESINRVETWGTLGDAMRINLHLRTAFHVLYHLKDFECRTPDELHAGALGFPWEEWLSPDLPFAVESDTDHPSIRDSRFPNLRIKDAVADRLRQVFGRRPDSGPDCTHAVVRLYWKGERASLFVDTSGEPLSRRGYRKLPFKAPLQEPLAAGLLLSTVWDRKQPLGNPMCGSGTLAIEAALLAMNKAPGLLRSNFGFMHLLPYDPAAWTRLRDEAQRAVTAKPASPIFASDIDPAAIDAARKNAAVAGVEAHIRFEVCDFAESAVPPEGGAVILNPEYGVRLGGEKDLEALYGRIGDFLKQRCKGCTGYVFTGSPDLLKRVGLKTKRRMIFFNAKIECRLAEYELYSGSRKQQGKEETHAPI